MSTTVTHDITLCFDCVQVVANGSTSADTGSEQTDIAAKNLKDGWGDATIVPADISDETFHAFSAAQCGGCGSTLAGERLDATVFATGN